MQPMINPSTAPNPQPINPILEAQRASWNRFSPGWRTWDEFTMRFLEPQGEAILSALSAHNGARVLDIATGTGDPGLTLASRVPGAKVVALDASDRMLRVAEDKAKARGLRNFHTVVGDACALEFADQSFDAVSCRLGFMFFPDTQVAANEMARVLRPGGRVATTVWAGPADNVWLTAIIGIVKKYVDVPSPPPGAPGIFRCADPAAVPALFAKAGLVVERIESMTGYLEYRSADQYWQFMNDVVPPIVAALTGVAPATIAAIKAEVLAALASSASEGANQLSYKAHLVVARK